MKKLKVFVALLLIANVCLFAMDSWGFDDDLDYGFFYEDEVYSVNSDTDCLNGGENATQCSINGGVSFGDGITAGCSVTCTNNTYACCGLRCTCKPYSLTKPGPSEWPAM